MLISIIFFIYGAGGAGYAFSFRVPKINSSFSASFDLLILLIFWVIFCVLLLVWVFFSCLTMVLSFWFRLIIWYSLDHLSPPLTCLINLKSEYKKIKKTNTDLQLNLASHRYDYLLFIIPFSHSILWLIDFYWKKKTMFLIPIICIVLTATTLFLINVLF